MKFITNNLKKAGVFNTILIAFGLLYDVARLFSASSILSIVVTISQILAFCFAFSYAFKGYKKNAAKSFKLFLYVYGLSILLTMINTLIVGKANISATIFGAIRLVCVLILAFVKDLGKKKSYIIAGVSFIFSIIMIVGQMIFAPSIFKSLITTLSGLILSAVLCVFIVAKYRDKEARGTK